MKPFTFSAITILLCAACGTKKPDMSNPAITGMATPVYDGMISAMSGSRLTTLPPFKVVYIMNDSLKVNNDRYVGIAWSDSSGYVPAGWLLLHGRPGVLNGALTAPVIVFIDPQLKTPSEVTLGEWQLVSIGKSDGGATEILFNNKDIPAVGYISGGASADSLDLVFFRAYKDAEKQKTAGNPGAMEGLAKDGRFASLASHQKMFGAGIPSNNNGKGRHTSLNWVNEKGVPLAVGDIPGEFDLYFIFEDGTESSINHLGDTLDNGYPRCMPVNKSVNKYKLVFTPAYKMDFGFELNVDLPSEFNERSGPYSQSFADAEPGKTYAFVVEYQNVSYVTCGDATIKVTTGKGLVGEGKLSGSCGD